MKALPGLAAALAVLILGVLTGGVPANAAPGPLARQSTGTRVWFHTGESQAVASDIWSFDSTTATGFRRSILPAATAEPVETQDPFTYRAGGTTVVLTWTASGGSGKIETLSYTAATDTMLVTVDGRKQSWTGCAATARPQFAANVC